MPREMWWMWWQNLNLQQSWLTHQHCPYRRHHQPALCHSPHPLSLGDNIPLELHIFLVSFQIDRACQVIYRSTHSHAPALFAAPSFTPQDQTLRSVFSSYLLTCQTEPCISASDWINNKLLTSKLQSRHLTTQVEQWLG